MTDESKVTAVAFAVGGSIDSGKCFDPNTSILMYDCTLKLAKNINVGDILMGDDSEKRTVLEVHSGIDEMFKIKSSDGQEYIVNGEHILCLKKLDEVVEISVREFLNLSQDKQSELKWFRTEVDFKSYENQTENTDDDSTDDDTKNFYTLGHLIGSHYFCKILQFDNTSDLTNEKMVDFTKLLNIKPHIPNMYKYSSKINRLKLLAGLVDTSYYYYRTDNEHIDIFLSDSENDKLLVSDVKFLIRSLGFEIYDESIGGSQTNGFVKISFGGNNTKNIPCLLKKFKYDQPTQPTQLTQPAKPNQFNITIESIGEGEYIGFQVDQNGRFLLEDFSVVHNSSLIGVLISSILDDGNGSARKLVAKHPHEIASGKTSDISTRIYDVPNSNKAVTLIDLCGHESYFKTTTFGVSGLFPDYAFLIVSANRGILQMTKQHLRLMLSLSVPIIIIVTHVDITPEEIYRKTIEGINKTCMMYAGKLVTTRCVNDYNDVNKTSEELEELERLANETILQSITGIADGKQTIFPIVTVSNKTGFFMNTIKKILADFPIRQFWLPGGEDAVLNNKLVKLFKISLEKQKEGLSNILPKYREFSGGVFYVDSAYNPPGVGLVVTGINRGDSVRSGDFLYMGPFGKEFKKIRVKGLHNNMRQVVTVLEDHNRGCINFAIVDKSEIRREQITKGIVVLNSLSLVKNVCYRFKAVITIFTNPTHSITLKTGYTPVIHLYTIRQSARMIIDPSENNGQDIITFDGKNTMVVIATFKFKQNPEFVEPFNRFVLRSGSIQGIGLVTSILPIDEDVDARPDPVKHNRSRFRNKPKIADKTKTIIKYANK